MSSPEQNLWCAVLERAIIDAHGNVANVTEAQKEVLPRQARRRGQSGESASL